MLYKTTGLFLLICFLLFSECSFSQVPPYYNYTTKEGLCNSNVYFMLQDNTGYVVCYKQRY